MKKNKDLNSMCIELNGAHIRIFEGSIMLLDDESEETQEYTWKEVFKRMWNS